MEKYPKGNPEKHLDKHRRSGVPHRSLSELPEDLQEVFRLKKRLEKLEKENGYISAGIWQGLLQTGQKDLQDLQVLRDKQMLDLYCQKNGLPSGRRVEEVLDLCGFTGKKNADLTAAAGLNQQSGDFTAREKPWSQGSDSAAADKLGQEALASRGEADRESNGGIKRDLTAQPAWVRAHNVRYLERALEEERDYLDHVLDAVDPQIRLDQAQRRMVLTDEDNCLVIAGAGAGKTTSVAAKVKYLVDRRGVKPGEILVISFTNKAVEELRARIQRDLRIPCPICTFHSAGNAVLHMQNPERVNIVDADKKFFVVRDYLRGKILQDPRLVHSLILFFASYFDAPLNEKNLEAFFRGIAQMRYTTMRSELDEYCAEIMDAQRKKKITIRNEVLRSAQEVEIANFLYRNGIDYVYEPVYRYHIEMARKPYTPDFVIRQGNREIYIEHFGITRDGQNSRYDEKRLRAYKDAVNEKVLLHRRHGTELIYTFSGYGDGRSLTEHLEEALRAHGVDFHPRSDEEILRKILQNEGNRYIRRLVMLICRFITNFKTDGYTEMQFAVMKESTQNVRTKLFLEICQACYLEYQKALQEMQAVDFEDMINDSARTLRECAEMKQRLGFKYIIVDEYQDISRQRFDLTRALREVCDAKVIAVGDDWQSIYAFSGSDITLFTQFQEKMGPSAMLRIENTYRNAQELIDIAGSFVQKNPAQITKTLHSAKRIEDPVIIYS
ncbi:MAG: UvrD-helicase domain-containing protein, partial [Eubacteriales bacterium]|nr:UvrD-helicase domain-containing protein [Eubacteriales bacterium]